MNAALLTSIAATGFAVAFLHAALPTHWLPFVLVGRGQNWSTRKTLGVTALAGVGHVAFTILLGGLVVGAGLFALPTLGHWFPYIVGALLIALGLFYILRHAHHARTRQPRRYASDRAAIVGLFVLLALSPCEAFLPVYLAGVQHGWPAFALLSAILLLATAAGMLLFTGLSLAGASRLKLTGLEKYEQAILGGALILLGIAVMVFEH